jgi:taurine transport system substrate-binding protein
MRQKWKKKGWLVFITLLIISIITGCGSSQSSGSNAEKGGEESKTIVYGGSSWLAHLPAYIAVEKGFFKEEGLNVEFKSFATSTERMTALASGGVDFASTGAISAISLMAAGDKSFSLFGVPDSYVGQEGIVGKNMTSVEDLKGKKLAVTFSSSSHVMVLDLLKQHGLEPNKDVQVLNMAGGDIVSSFTTGEIDAAAIWSPHFEKIQEVEGAKVLAKDTDTTMYKNHGFGAGPDVLVIRSKFAKENPETTEKLLKGYFKATDWIKENPREAAELFVKVTNLDVDEQEKIIKNIDWLGLDQQKDMLKDKGDFKATLDFLADFMVDNKLISTKVKVKEWVNIDILPE